MYLIFFYLSICSFLIPSIFGRYIGTLGVSFITTSFIFLSNLLSFFILYEVVVNQSICSIYLFNWINLEFLNVNFKLYFDTLTSLMLVVITSISLCAHIYSVEYMKADPHQSRFMIYLSLFTFFMIVLVTSSNLFQLFLGWEGVGLCSYLLINFWYTRIQANKSALKAMLTNKVSDICLAIGIFILFNLVKSVTNNIIFLSSFYLDSNLVLNNAILIACILLLIGAIGKSAQIGLHIWLPDAMEGPTPVSSLIHAATMVTAGIFLIIRCSYLFELNDSIFLYIILIGTMTALFASTTGLVQNDIKKVVAYSTCSQLGYMFFICGCSGYQVGFFHLFNHAFFKALLFLTAGAIIHSFNNEQDIRNMGGFIKIFPFFYICLFIGSLSLMGFPFLTGFYSKDLIIEFSYYISSLNLNSKYLNFYISYIHSITWILIVSIVLTSFYSLRVLVLVFFEKYNGYVYYIKNIHYSHYYTIIPLFYLSILSIFIGFIFKDLIVGVGTNAWGTSIFNSTYYISYEFMNNYVKLIPLLYSSYGISLVLFFYIFSISIIHYNYTIYKIFIFFNQKWFIDKVYNEYLIKNILLKISKYCFKYFDKGILELFGPYGFSKLVSKFSNILSNMQTGLVYHYVGLVVNFFIYSTIVIIIYILL